MSRDLLGLVFVAIICIIISPFYNDKMTKIEYPIKNTAVTTYINTSETIKVSNPKTIVFLSDSFIPTTFAGSEISAYETLKYFQARGHTIIIFVKIWKVSEYNGLKIHKYDETTSFYKNHIKNCDVVFFQMGDEAKNLQVFQNIHKPVYVFIHVVNSYQWLIQQKMRFPITVVYNSNMTQDTIPTIYDNMRMIPYVNTSKFKKLRELTIQNDVVCLINCNKNKGGELLVTLAYNMPDVQFLGVKGGYSNQIIEKTAPSNLTYIENQEDITVVFKKIGILIMPSTNETWGRTAVEAMASGVPVIHSEAPGLVECIDGAGILCNRNDEDAWVEAIRRILGDRAYRERLRQYGFKRITEIEKEQLRGRQELAYKIENI
jgi:glycosyltransferase involved in cell wall biosynthesis